MSDIPHTKDWEGFFQTLRLFPVLWDRNLVMRATSNSHNEIGQRRLLHSYQKIYPLANLNTLQRCLISIRLCFARELRKVLASKKSVLHKKDAYQPALWYFRHLTIVRDRVRRAKKKPKRNKKCFPNIYTDLKFELH